MSEKEILCCLLPRLQNLPILVMSQMSNDFELLNTTALTLDLYSTQNLQVEGTNGNLHILSALRQHGYWTILPSTGWFIWFIICKQANMSLFWHLWRSKVHQCDPKTGRKLLFGTKYSQMEFRVSQEDDCLKKEFQDLLILAQYTGWTKNNFCFLY